MLLAWCSDIHLNFLRDKAGPYRFGQKVAKELQDYSDEPNRAVLVTGDIGEAQNFRPLLEEFIRGVGLRTYFVLGNHDIYGSSVKLVHDKARSLSRDNPNAVWLTESGVIELGPETCLVGNDGWYDVRNGSPQTSRVEMSDFEHIQDLMTPDVHGWYTHAARHVLFEKARALADKSALAAKKILMEAASRYPKILFGTHVPPFPGAAWHQGKPSDGEWLPWMSSRVMGEAIVEVAQAHEDREFIVLCGHTHGHGEYTALPNVVVRTASAVYGSPSVYDILET